MSRPAARGAGSEPPRPVPAPPKSPEREARRDSAPGGGRRRRGGRRGSRSRLPATAVVFIGPMAAGKTSLGRRVAKELGIPFVDTDAVFVRGHGPIAAFFAEHGEAEFRRIEAEIVRSELATPGPRIVALGGGAVLDPATREILAAHPVVLLMTTEAAVLRTANIAKRPLLRDDPGAWSRILDARLPLYEEAADVVFRTDRATKEQLAGRVVQWIRAPGRTAARPNPEADPSGAPDSTKEPKR